MSDETMRESLSEDDIAKIKNIIEEVVSRRLAAIHIPLILPSADPLLRQEVTAQFARIIEPQVTIGAGIGLGLTPTVFRPGARGLIQSSGSVTPRYITPDTLITLDTSITPDASKKFWESPLGSAVLQIAVMFFIFFYQECSLDVRDARAEKVMREVVQQIEEFWLAHKKQPQPTPKPTASPTGDYKA